MDMNSMYFHFPSVLETFRWVHELHDFFFTFQVFKSLLDGVG